jgi:hypothetical protein
MSKGKKKNCNQTALALRDIKQPRNVTTPKSHAFDALHSATHEGVLAKPTKFLEFFFSLNTETSKLDLTVNLHVKVACRNILAILKDGEDMKNKEKKTFFSKTETKRATTTA